MADTKISALTELAGGIAPSDELVIVDKSDTTMAASGTDKRLKAGWLPTLVRRSSDSAARSSANTGTTLTNDDTLLWPVLASEVWFFEGFLLVNAANATMDLKVTVVGPTGATASIGGNAVAGASQPGYGLQVVSGAPVAMAGIGTAITVGTLTGTTGVGIGGVVVVSSTAGNVTLQWAQNTSDAGNLVMKANSFLRLQRLA